MIGNSYRLAAALGMVSAFALSAAVTAPVYAQESEQRDFDIPAQSLSRAIVEFSRQSEQVVTVPAALTRGKRSVAVHGRMTAAEALERLISGSGLEMARGQGGALTVRPLGNGQGGANLASSDGEDVGSSDKIVKNDPGVSEILVVGKKTQNTDIRRTENDAQPYVILTGDEVQQSGASTVSDFLRTRLPMNQATSSGPSGSIGRIDLRGLGSNQTLVLIDGRRAPATLQFGDFSQPDLSGIPPAQVDRIEVLPASASGIYGGGATGGVVNVILKHNYNGLDLAARYENTDDFAASALNISVNGGKTFNNGHTSISFSLARRNADTLAASDREEILSGPARLAARTTPSQPLAKMLPSLLPNVCAGNGVTCSTTNLVLDNGTSLGSNHTFVPDGYLGPYPTGANDGGQALASNGGAYDFSVRGVAVLPDENYSGSFDLRHSFSRTIEAYLHVDKRHAESAAVQASQALVNIPGASLNNPFQQDIIVTFPGPNTPSRFGDKALTLRGGLIAKLPHGWSSSLEYSRTSSSNTSHSEAVGSVTPTAAGTAFLQTVALSDPITVVLPQNYSSLFNYTISDSSFSLLTKYLSARAGGPLFRLPGGSAVLNTVYEHGDESSDDLFLYQKSSVTSAVTTRWRPSMERNADSWYAELHAPILSSKNELSFAYVLEATFALRRDQSTVHIPPGQVVVPSSDGPFPAVNEIQRDFSSNNYTIALEYAPVRGLAFRGSYATGYLAPGLVDLAPPTITPNFPAFLFRLVDPRRGGSPVTGSITYTSGGNPNLEPEKSHTLALGAIMEPRFLPGLRLSLDRVAIDKSGELSTIGAQGILNQEALLPGRVIRGPNLAGDPAGYAGPVIAIDNSEVNFASTRVVAYDFQLDYRWSTSQWGNWRAYIIGTRQTEFAHKVAPTAPMIDSVGFNNGQLRWRANFGIDWDKGPWSVQWSAQYFDEFNICNADLSATDCATRQASQGAEHIPVQIYHDLSVRYKVGTAYKALAGFELALGIQNLFDTKPPASFLGASGAAYGDLRLRRFTFSLSKHFGL